MAAIDQGGLGRVPTDREGHKLNVRRHLKLEIDGGLVAHMPAHGIVERPIANDAHRRAHRAHNRRQRKSRLRRGGSVRHGGSEDLHPNCVGCAQIPCVSALAATFHTNPRRRRHLRNLQRRDGGGGHTKGYRLLLAAFLDRNVELHGHRGAPPSLNNKRMALARTDDHRVAGLNRFDADLLRK